MRARGIGAAMVLWVALVCACGSSVHGKGLMEEGFVPEGFVNVKEAIPSLILDIRYATSHNFVGDPIDGYGAAKCILTKKAARALAAVQEELLSFGLSLKVYDCYRPQQAVDHFVRWAKDVDDTRMKKEFYPKVDKVNLFKDVYIADKSGHTRGSTLDVTIVALPVSDEGGYTPGQPLYECLLPATERFKDSSIDMGTGFDCFDEMSHTQNPAIGPQQRMHRLLLRSLMDKHGFVNYDKEWWHFTLSKEPFPQTYFNFPVQ